MASSIDRTSHRYEEGATPVLDTLTPAGSAHDPKAALRHALAINSPRLNPPRTPLRAVLIHGAVAFAFSILFARAFGAASGYAAWSVGIAYIAYDTILIAFVAFQCRALLAAPRHRIPSAARPSLCVVVAAHNEAAHLPTTIRTLLDQNDPPDEILIADDGSTDATPTRLAEEFSLATPLRGETAIAKFEPRLRWRRLPHAGKAHALNDAILHTDAELVLTIDADTALHPGAIAAMRDAFANDPNLVAATGILAPTCDKSISGRLFVWFQTYEYMRNFLSRYAWMQAGSLLLISGAFAGFRANAIRSVGGFDAECLVEDYELIHRLRRHAARNGLTWTTAVIGHARASTDAPATIPAFLRQRRRWFGGFLQTQFWYRDMIGDPKLGALGLAMLPVKAVDTMQPIFGLTAALLLIADLARGRLDLLLPAGAVITTKLAIDFAYHLWSVRLYRRWTGEPHAGGYVSALIAALCEPFGFQIVRHLGAALGWVTALSGRRHWS